MGNKKTPNKGKRKQRAAPKKKKQIKRSIPQQVGGQLSECAREYAAALRDPENAPLSCVPNQYPPLPSFKFRTWTKGSFGIGTNGIGCVIVEPGVQCKSDLNSVFVSGATYTLVTFPVTYVETGLAGATSNSPFTAANFTSGGVQARLVGCVLKVWPLCKEQDLSGESYALSHPDNENLNGLTVADLNAYSGTLRHQTTTSREPIMVCWTPTRPADVDYTDMGAAQGTASMGVLVSGVAGSSGWMGYSVHCQWEAIGKLAPNKSLSVADPEGFSAVLTAVQAEGTSVYKSSTGAVKSLLADSYRYVKSMSGPVMNMAAKYAVGAGMSYLGFPMGGVNAGMIGNSVSTPTITEIDKRANLRDGEIFVIHKPTGDPLKQYYQVQTNQGTHSWTFEGREDAEQWLENYRNNVNNMGDPLPPIKTATTLPKVANAAVLPGAPTPN